MAIEHYKAAKIHNCTDKKIEKIILPSWQFAKWVTFHKHSDLATLKIDCFPRKKKSDLKYVIMQDHVKYQANSADGLYFS